MPPKNDINFRSLCANTSSSTIFAHVRMAPEGSDVQQFNSHPFTFGRHLFMHNGGIAHFEELRRPMGNLMEKKAFANVRGTTDSEYLAGLYMKHLSGPNEDWHKEYTLEEMKIALEKAIADVFKLQTELVPGVTTNTIPANSLNLCTTDGKKLLAFRFRNTAAALKNEGSQPPSLYISTTAGAPLNRKFPGHPNFALGVDIPMIFAAGLVGNDTIPTEKHGDHLIVSSEPTTKNDDEWTLVDKNEAVMVQFLGGKLDLKIEKIDIPGFEGV